MVKATSGRSSKQGLNRRTVVGEIMAGIDDAAIVTGLGSPTYDVASVEDRDRNFYLWGAMGAAVALGLGLALARKDLDVLVVTGDGEMLMGMGSLATVAVKSPENLSILVLDNGLYGETGMQQSHAGLGCDLSEVAAACGIRNSWTISTHSELQAIKEKFHSRGSVRFLRAIVANEELERVMPTRDAVENKLRFRKSIDADGLGQ
ncbi:MAG: aldehyde dehydrogenase [Gammaproteobacteria bacterium]|nr:aldehyde dehydrogenase [Gammaproteobacteria bacterium]